ncbi:MAG TPA: STT3 domain-containing protein [Candidatus Nanoarchaeia archaeon]|nr:STT3 domain-containing protein [Candidatus Nanoarchaeia archaeon]
MENADNRKSRDYDNSYIDLTDDYEEKLSEIEGKEKKQEKENSEFESQPEIQEHKQKYDLEHHKIHQHHNADIKGVYHTEKKKDELTFDFSKIFKLRKKEEHKEQKQKESDDIKGIWNFLYKHRAVFLLIIPIILMFFFRGYPNNLPVAEDWAKQNVYNYYANQVRSQIDSQYPNLPEANKKALADSQFKKFLEENKAQVEENVKQNAQFIKDQMKDENGYTYLSDIDSYTWLRYARNIDAHGYPGDTIKNNRQYDTHVIAPLGSPVDSVGIHPWMIILNYKLLKIFSQKITIMQASFYVPFVFSIIAIIAAFFIVRKIAGNIGGLFAGIIVAIHPFFLMRSFGSDTDVYNVAFPLLVMWFFVEAFEAKGTRKGIIFAALTGATLGVYSLAWSYWYLYDFILATIFLYLLYYTFAHNKQITSVKKFFHHPPIKSLLIITLVFVFFTGIFVTFFSDFNSFISGPIEPLSFLTLKQAVKQSLWPNVYTTVAELNPASWPEVVNSIGGGFLLVLSIIGILFTAFKKDEHGYPDLKYIFLLAIWFGATIFATTKGVRFILLLIAPFAVGFGIFVGTIHQYSSRWLNKEFKVNKYLASVIVLILLSLLLVNPIKAADAASKNEIPIMNDAWYNSLTAIKDNSQKNAIINSWWDFGHHFKYVADRAVTFDGASQNTPQAHWIGKTLLTSDENEAVGILRMLDCGANTAFEEIDAVKKDVSVSVKIINRIVVSEKEKAREILRQEGFDADKISKILEKTHCDPPEDFFITSEDMVGKSGVWAHFGSWDFNKAELWVEVKKLPKEQAIKYMMEKPDFNYTREQAEKMYLELQTIITDNDANSWVAPWPSYAGESNCNAVGRTLNCDNGIKVDIDSYLVSIPTQDGVKNPEVVVFKGAYDLEERRFYNNTVQLGAAVISDSENYRIVLMQTPLAKSTFTRLFYFNGFGSKYFNILTYQRSVFGNQIYVWKVNWLGKSDEELKNRKVVNGNRISVNYIGYLENGEIFDSSIVDWRSKNINAESKFSEYKTQPLIFEVGSGQLIGGFDSSVLGMKIGDEKTVTIPPQDAYGTDPAAHALGNKTLIFKIRLERIE